jgi:hypothetical protein
VFSAGDGTTDGWDYQINLNAFRAITVDQWPGQPQAYYDYVSSPGDFTNATLFKGAGWDEGEITVKGIVVRNMMANEVQAFCAVFNLCNHADQKVLLDFTIDQQRANRGLCIWQTSNGDFDVSGTNENALGVTLSNEGRAFYCSGQTGGVVRVRDYRVLGCGTSDAAFYVSVQGGGLFEADRVYAEQLDGDGPIAGVSSAFRMWMKNGGTTRILRSHFRSYSSLRMSRAIRIDDVDGHAGETIFERVVADAGGAPAPTMAPQIAAILADAPGIVFRNCVLHGDQHALVLMQGGESADPAFPNDGSFDVEIVNSIVTCHQAGAHIIADVPSSVLGKMDGNCYHVYRRAGLPDGPAATHGFYALLNEIPATSVDEYISLAAWKRATGKDLSSMVMNPNMRDHLNGNLRLRRDSVCRDAGVICPLITDEDADGVPATHISSSGLSGMGGTAIDIGAYEFAYDGQSMGTSKRYGVPIYGLQKDGKPIIDGWFLG